MKKTLKKIISIVFTFLICISTATGFAFAEDDLDDDIMLPPAEEVKISIIYAPIKSRIIYDQFGPMIDGMILKITYFDGKTEILKVEKVENSYKAGEFSVSSYCFFFEATGQLSNYGTKTPKIYVSKHENDVLYEGVTDFSVLSIPSPIEIYYCLKTIVKICL